MQTHCHMAKPRKYKSLLCLFCFCQNFPLFFQKAVAQAWRQILIDRDWFVKLRHTVGTKQCYSSFSRNFSVIKVIFFARLVCFNYTLYNNHKNIKASHGYAHTHCYSSRRRFYTNLKLTKLSLGDRFFKKVICAKLYLFGLTAARTYARDSCSLVIILLFVCCVAGLKVPLSFLITGLSITISVAFGFSGPIRTNTSKPVFRVTKSVFTVKNSYYFVCIMICPSTPGRIWFL